MTSHYNNPPPFYFGGFGAPPMPYGVSTRFGSPIPPPGLHYDYSAPAGGHGTYGPVTTYPPGGFGGALSLSLIHTQTTHTHRVIPFWSHLFKINRRKHLKCIETYKRGTVDKFLEGAKLYTKYVYLLYVYILAKILDSAGFPRLCNWIWCF